MKNFVLLIASVVLLISCSGRDNQELNSQQLEAEKAKVMETIKDYNTAYQNKSFANIIELLSEDVMFFGTDSSEVIRSLNEFKTMIQEQWKHYDIKYGDISDPLVIIDDKATVASVVFGIPGTIKTQNTAEQQEVFFRIARTLKKQSGKWVIASGIVGIAKANHEITPQAETGKEAGNAKATPQLK